MPFKVRCPNQHLLLVKDELAGQPLHCPLCHAFVGPHAAPVPLAPAEILTEFDWALSGEEMPTPVSKHPHQHLPTAPVTHPISRKERRQRLRFIGLGLLLLAVAMILFLAGAPLWHIPSVWIAAPVLLLLSQICEVTGMVLFYQVPREAEARATLSGALAMVGLRMGLTVVTLLEVFTPYQLLPGDEHVKVFVLVALDILVWMVHKVLLFWFLHLLADYVDAEGIAHDVRRLLSQVILLPVGTVFWLLFIPRLIALPLWLGPLFAIVGLLTGLALAGWWGLYLLRYIALMFTFRRRLQE